MKEKFEDSRAKLIRTSVVTLFRNHVELSNLNNTIEGSITFASNIEEEDFYRYEYRGALFLVIDCGPAIQGELPAVIRSRSSNHSVQPIGVFRHLIEELVTCLTKKEDKSNYFYVDVDTHYGDDFMKGLVWVPMDDILKEVKSR